MALPAADPGEPRFGNGLPKNLSQLMLKECSKVVHPVDLSMVCKQWRAILREGKDFFVDNDGRKKDDSWSKFDFWDLNPFMRVNLNSYWNEIIRNSQVRYTDENENSHDIPFQVPLHLDTSDIGDSALSKYGEAHKIIRIARNLEEFLEEKNDGKIVVFVATYEDTKKSPYFYKVMSKWNPGKAPVGMFFLHDDPENNCRLFNFVLTDLNTLSSRTLFGNFGVADCTTESVFGRSWHIPYDVQHTFEKHTDKLTLMLQPK